MKCSQILRLPIERRTRRQILTHGLLHGGRFLPFLIKVRRVPFTCELDASEPASKHSTLGASLRRLQFLRCCGIRGSRRPGGSSINNFQQFEHAARIEGGPSSHNPLVRNRSK